MSDILEKGFFLSQGALALTKEKAEAIVNDLIEKGKLSQEDSSKVFSELMAKAEDEKKAFDERLDKVLDRALQRLGLATAKDIEKIQKQLDKITKLLKDNVQ